MKIEYGHIYICTEAERLGLGHRQCLVRVTGIERKPGGGIGRLEVYEIGSKQNARRYIYPEHLLTVLPLAKWDGYCAKYGRNCPTCIALDALEAG